VITKQGQPQQSNSGRTGRRTRAAGQANAQSRVLSCCPIPTVQRAVGCDTGSVWEITPDLGVAQQGETRLGLPPGGLDRRLADVGVAGSLGVSTAADVHRVITAGVSPLRQAPPTGSRLNQHPVRAGQRRNATASAAAMPRCRRPVLAAGTAWDLTSCSVPPTLPVTASPPDLHSLLTCWRAGEPPRKAVL
jgi:hypothetical protein